MPPTQLDALRRGKKAITIINGKMAINNHCKVCFVLSLIVNIGLTLSSYNSILVDEFILPPEVVLNRTKWCRPNPKCLAYHAIFLVNSYGATFISSCSEEAVTMQLALEWPPPNTPTTQTQSALTVNRISRPLNVGLM